MELTRRQWLALGATGVAALGLRSPDASAQANGTIVFVSRRPSREFLGNIRAWAQSVRVNSYAEDTTSHVWRVQFMAFLTRPPRTAEVNLVFYKLEGRSRHYITVEPIALSNPGEAIFYHQTILHRAPGEFEPMENYEMAITVADSRGSTEVARGRIGLVGQVERRAGVVDFTGAGGPTVR